MGVLDFGFKVVFKKTLLYLVVFSCCKSYLQGIVKPISKIGQIKTGQWLEKQVQTSGPLI